MLYRYVKNEDYLSYYNPKRKRKISYLISFSCFILGIALLTYSLFPYIRGYIKSNKNVSRSLLSPSSAINSEIYLNKEPNNQETSSDYLSNVNRNFSLTNQGLHIDQKTFPEYANIKGEIKLSIEKLKVSDLPVKINVDSFDNKSYLPTLEKYLGHFKGTSLPDKPGNTFIYGHSANELLARAYPNTPKYAFSFLGDMDIGDEIVLEYNGKEYKYSAQKFKMVAPEDISPIYTNSNDQILTLMTCWPPGIGSERLIVTSKLVN